MVFSGAPNNIIINNILSGFYYQSLDRGSKPHLFEFSSPSNPISNYQSPYDARLDYTTGNISTLIAVGQRVLNTTNPTFNSDLTGILYYYDNEQIYGTCHGFGNDNLTYYNGYNFYNAPYPIGYFSPPFGENITISQYSINGTATGTLPAGVCSPLTLTEYNQNYGINPIVDVNATISANDLIPGQFVILATPKAACPEDSISNFFDEATFNIIQGTTTELGANNFFNSNPIPTALDNFEIRVSNRYSIFSSGDPTQNYINYQSGKPIASYSTKNQNNKLNNSTCYAQIIETQTDFGVGTNGLQLLLTPDNDASEAVGSQTSFIGVQDPWNMWQFNFLENSETFPFSDDYNSVSEPTQATNANQGSQIFNSTLAIESNYWQNRECPTAIDYLPWTFGASILACPSYYFDVPYYAAINKFGFYGMRFLNSCASLNLQYPWSGVNNAIELPTTSNSYLPIGSGTSEIQNIDSKWTGNFNQYDNLLMIAQAESSYSNMYAMNKGFFLWTNNYFIQQSQEFNLLYNNYPEFKYLYSGLITPFYSIFSGDIGNYLNFQPNLIVTNSGFITTNSIANTLLTNDVYLQFRQGLDKIISGQDINNWVSLENDYAYYVTYGAGNINEGFYKNIVTGSDARIATRYYENIVHGNPVDLFPLNNVTFSFDNASDYLENSGWGRSTTSFGTNSNLPDINRRYFAGAYGNGDNISGVLEVLNNLQLVNNSYFYPGFFNDINVNKMMANPSYESVLSGTILDEQNRSYSPNGWLALGYNEIGTLDKNFSCFTPIFVQQPLNQVFCKIGQAPTLRALAVDYHSIPDDKISARYPEIIYWAYKLKILDQDFNNLYPIQYKWYRILQSDYTGFIQNGDFSLTDDNDPNKSWACMEGDNSPNCTIINPLESMPTGTLSISENYTFVQGVNYGTDDQYNYFCLASGRFGIRISEPTSLVIENWLKFDISFKNGINSDSTLAIDFNITDYKGIKWTIDFPASTVPAYNGYQRDEYAIVEASAKQKIPPPNAGYGDVSALAPAGSIKYIGALRSYSPSFLTDTRGLNESWGQFIDYGTLVPFYKTLSQNEGNLIYGYSHLPVCTNYQMNNGQVGLQVNPTLNGNKILHWSLAQKAVASFQNIYVGVPWEGLNTFGALYPPITPIDYLAGDNYETMGVGQWQWYNNFGAIKRFGYLSDASTNDIQMVGNGAPNSSDINGTNIQINAIKKLLIQPDYLAGSNCGYTPFGLGRNMIFYIEAFDRFYLYCDPKEKQNIYNLNYMNPGIRLGNSATQYFWLGQPSNTYLKRTPMYGPYAYQWSVQRHNRDRNGNGISLGFYSMGWNKPYSQMYDAPAIYGLYYKINSSPSYISLVNNIISLRNQMGWDELGLRGFWFGTTNNEGSASNYGNTFVDCTDYPDSLLCQWYSAFSSLASSPDFNDHGCAQDKLAQGQCFDPCLSIRYSQGFFPGGKTQNLFNAANSDNKNIHLVSIANNLNNNIIINEEQSKLDKTVYFRAPTNTPYAIKMREMGYQSAGVSPCKDAGADHCNYITSTIHLGTTSFLQGETTALLGQINGINSLIGGLT